MFSPDFKPTAHNDKYVACPFCGENDFDLIGLKTHLQVDCDVFERTKIGNTFRFETAADRRRKTG